MLLNHIFKIYGLYVSQNVTINDEKVGMWKDLGLAAGCTMTTFVSRETGEMHEHISQVFDILLTVHLNIFILILTNLMH